VTNQVGDKPSVRNSLAVVLNTATPDWTPDRNFVTHPTTNHWLTEILPVAMEILYETNISESTGFCELHFLQRVYELPKKLVLVYGDVGEN
jgi:hypothetical protein